MPGFSRPTMLSQKKWRDVSGEKSGGKPGESLVRHRHRHPDFRQVVEADADEPGRRDADDREGVAVDVDLLPDDLIARAEQAPPETVADHGHRMSADHAVIVSGDQPAAPGARAQDVEVLARDDRPGQPLGPSFTEAQVHRVRVGVRREPVERRRTGPVVGEDRVGVVVDVVRVALGVDGADADHLVQPIDRQRPEEQPVDEAEDGRVDADAERKRQDGRRRETRMLREHPDGVPKVGYHAGTLRTQRTLTAPRTLRTPRT